MKIAPNRTRKDAKEARVRHDVDFYTRSDGQAELRVTADAADVRAIYQTIQDAARKLGAIEKGADQPRSAGQLRVAALLALVTGTMADADSGQPARPYKVTVNVTMDLPTLLGLRDNPALLDGYGALPPSLARSLAADGSWRRLLHDQTTGHLLDLGRLRYRPSPALADYVRTRDRTCIFPYCNRRAAHLRPRPRPTAPPRRIRRRTHQPAQPAVAVPKTPPGQARNRLDPPHKRHGPTHLGQPPRTRISRHRIRLPTTQRHRLRHAPRTRTPRTRRSTHRLRTRRKGDR